MGDSNVEVLALSAWGALPDASSLVFDAELQYVIARGPVLGLHGFISTDLEGQFAGDALPRERWLLFEPLYRDALNGETGSVEVASLDERRCCRVQVVPLRGPDGGIVGGVALAVDVTALKQAEERYRGLLESAPDAMVVVDADGVIQLANAQTQTMFGYASEDALVGCSVEMLIPQRFEGQHVRQRAAFARTPKTRRMGAGLDLWGRRKDGSEFPVDVALASVATDEGTLVTAVIRDVEAERRAAESLVLLETLQATAPVGFLFVDRDFRIRRINDTLAVIAGTPAQDQIGRLVADVVPTLWPALEGVFRSVLDAGETVLDEEILIEFPNDPERVRTFLGNHYPVRIRGEIIGVGVVIIEITDRRTAEEFREAVMENMAEGLYALDGEGRLTYMNPAASAMLGFAEDELLGKPMHEAVHFQHADGSAFPAQECELLTAVSNGHPFRKAEDAFTRKDGTIFPTAYSAAALGTGASAHGAVVVFHDTTEERAEEIRAQRELDALTWVGRIRDALDEDRLVLYSQPILPLTGEEPSEELLVRMIGRDGELIPPGSFLPVAEKYGLIREIDLWVIGQAARLAASGRHVFHANLSAHSIGNLALLSEIEQQISAFKPDPSKLVFEITETALIGNIQAGEAFVRGLADLGCAIALDDFGTGFGSFTYLKRLPVQYLKIDVEFIRDLATSNANQHLVKAIVLLAKGFEQLTVAEGVEDAETLELLRDYGVDFAQGFHIGRPAPITTQ
jgi:PAS domain S-box-containing protein